MNDVKVTAVYAGSFDPFTNGHLDILKKAAKCFNRVIVLLAQNSNKKRTYNISDEIRAIEKTLMENGLSNCIVAVTNTLVVDFCAENNASVIVRGLRNFQDFGDEENIASFNKRIAPDIETIYFRASDACISSSAVKELYSYNKPIIDFVPLPIYNMMINSFKNGGIYNG